VKQGELERLSRAFKALSHPNRLQLFLNLLDESKLDLAEGREHNCFLIHLLRNLKIGAPTVSHHVKELADAELIRTRRDGKQLACSVNPDTVRELRALFDAIV